MVVAGAEPYALGSSQGEGRGAETTVALVSILGGEHILVRVPLSQSLILFLSGSSLFNGGNPFRRPSARRHRKYDLPSSTAQAHSAGTADSSRSMYGRPSGLVGPRSSPRSDSRFTKFAHAISPPKGMADSGETRVSAPSSHSPSTMLSQ